MKTFTKLLSLSALALTMAACFAKVEGVGGAPGGGVPSGPTKADAVSGPSLDGDWTSSCVQETIFLNGRFVDGSAIIKMKIKGREVSRLTTEYSDRSCYTVASEKEKKGSFRYIEAKANGVYRVEYQFALGNGVTELPEEDIQLKDGVLAISNFNIPLNYKLTKSGAAPSPGSVNCAERKVAMDDLKSRTQTRYEKAMSDAMRGIPARNASDLAQEARAFEQKYGETRCDGQQTTRSFVESINRMVDEINRWQ